MKAKKTYLKARSVFIVSLFVIGITAITIFLTGENYNRTITSNLYLSLSIISGTLFLFLTYGLYKGVRLIDNFPKFKSYQQGDFIAQAGDIDIDFPSIDLSDGIEGIFVSILLWIGMTILIIVLLVVLEFVFWLSLFTIIIMLYWGFLRALRLVFRKSDATNGDIVNSIYYSLSYTIMYTGWIYGIVFLSEMLR